VLLVVEKMKEINIALELYKSPKKVFSVHELSLMFAGIDYKNLKRRLSYLVKSGKLKRLRRGVLAKDDYNIREVVNKIYKPSYISLETVLAKKGLIFQSYESVFAVSYVNRQIEIDGRKIVYRRLKESVLVNSLGIRTDGFWAVASKERAFLDTIYVYKNYHIDNLAVLDWDRVFEILEIYKNHSFVRRINSYYKLYKEENVR